jgi:hypothetical protein
LLCIIAVIDADGMAGRRRMRSDEWQMYLRFRMIGDASGYLSDGRRLAARSALALADLTGR